MYTAGIPDLSSYVVGDFKKLTPIAHGGGGRIYKGEHDDFGEIVIKEFFWSNKQPPERYQTEIEMLRKLRHPNIVQLFGLLWNGADKEYYMGYVMEYIPGGSLSDRIHAPDKSYDTIQICRWIKQIGLGLQFLHRKEVIHRDIKPENILLANDQPKLADFGIAREIGVSNTTGSGTYRYMAPEVITSGKYGSSADIYSLAITIWELFHRKIPYSEHEITGYLQKIIDGTRPTINPDIIEEDSATFLERCWHHSTTRPPIKEVIVHFETKLDQVLVDAMESSMNLKAAVVAQTKKQSDTILMMCGNDTEILILNREKTKWITAEKSLPCGIMGGGTVYLNNELYIFGGYSYKKSLRRLSHNEWICLADMHVGRSEISNSSLGWNGFIWVFGGCNEDNEGYKSSERYDPKLDKWIELPDMAYPRGSASATVHLGKMFVCGGFSGPGQWLHNIECFDPERNAWTELYCMQIPTNGPCLVSYRDKLLLMGGAVAQSNNRQEQTKSVLEIFPYEVKKRWEPLPEILNWHQIPFGLIFDDEIFVLGGFYSPNQALDNLMPVHKTDIFNGKSWRHGPSLLIERCIAGAVVIPQRLADILCVKK